MIKPPTNNVGPPLFGTWWKFYTAVIVWLVLLIISFYFFTLYYS